MPEPLKLLTDKFDTPIGEMIIVADRDGNLRAVDWTDHTERLQNLLRRHYGRNGFTLEPANNPSGLTDTMRRYFAGELTSIDALPVQTAGTPFQREVWRALREIPHGTTLSYGKLAERIGRPNAVRAVGLANGSNPIGVVIPCHRVIGSNGSLTGYGGGIERKRWLLNHEDKAHQNKEQAARLPSTHLRIQSQQQNNFRGISIDCPDLFVQPHNDEKNCAPLRDAALPPDASRQRSNMRASRTAEAIHLRSLPQAIASRSAPSLLLQRSAAAAGGCLHTD